MQHSLLEKVDNLQVHRPFKFKVGDTVSLKTIIKEAGKERIQVFEGIIIRIRGRGMSKTFTIRKIGANSIGVERTFPFFCPTIADATILKSAKVRQSRIYFLRKRIGKAARL